MVNISVLKGTLSRAHVNAAPLRDYIYSELVYALFLQESDKCGLMPSFRPTIGMSKNDCA